VRKILPSDDVTSKNSKTFPGANVVKDRPDVRDLPYRPTLGVLRGVQPVPKAITAYPNFIRTQGDGSCTAHALASVIDILRLDAKLKGRGRLDPAPLVSAEMLYERGKEIDSVDFGAHSAAGEGLWSLRSAIKAFYHNGVCEEGIYTDSARANRIEPREIRVYRHARQTPLGSYYRVDPVLNDYHAALNEVGVIYAAAEIHGGWLEEKVRQNRGQIIFDDATAGLAGGKHAFAIVGYTERGFLVLNSWGSDWGGYREGSGKPIKGVALWPYYDWAERILDGWVLRLGVKAPDAFKYSFGRQGLGDFLTGQIKEGSTPRFELVGHYAHIDDGAFVAAGSLPTKIEDVRDTCSFLRKKLSQKPDPKTGEPKSYTKVLLWVPGGSDKIKDIAANIAATKQLWRQRGVYPFTIIWCSDLLDQASAVLSKFAEGALANVGRGGTAFDTRLERDARSIGRAVWRDVYGSAKKAAAHDKGGDHVGAGAAQQILDAFARLPNEIEISIVAEGAGAILVHELIAENPDLAERIASFNFVMPAISLHELDDFVRRSKAEKRTKVFVASPATLSRLRYGEYNGSLLDLVQMTFVENPPARLRDASADQQRAENSKPDPKNWIAGLVNGESVELSAEDHSGDALITESKRIYARNRIVGVTTAEELRAQLPRLQIAEIDVQGSNNRVTNLRDVTAGKEVIAKIQEALLGAGQAVPPGDYGPVRGNPGIGSPVQEVIELKSQPKPPRPEVRLPEEPPAPPH
jgi:hypothetical protein